MREPLCGAPCSRSRLRVHVRQASKWETKGNGAIASDRCVNSSTSDKIVKGVRESKKNRKQQREREKKRKRSKKKKRERERKSL